MLPRVFAALLSLTTAACSRDMPGDATGQGTPKQSGQIVVAVTVDWEGAYALPEGLDALDSVRVELAGAPITHFVSAGYFTKQPPDPSTAEAIRHALRPGDELAVHLHGWSSLAARAGVQPRISPSFLTGTDKLLELGDGDLGFDLDLDAYTATDLRILLRTSRQLLGTLGVPVSKSFRAGGYLGTPRLLQAIRDEGFTVDSSAADASQLPDESSFRARVEQLWPDVDATTQPFRIPQRGGHLIELPIAAIADYTTAARIIELFIRAQAALARQPQTSVYIVLAFHQETAGDFAPEISDALHAVRQQAGLSKDLVFVTIEQMARRTALAAPPAP